MRRERKREPEPHGSPLRRDEPLGPAPPADLVPETGRDDLIPIGDRGEQAIGRRAAGTAKGAGLEAEDEDR